MARRGENIRKRKDGLWEGRYISDYNVEGKAIYKSIYNQSYLELKKALAIAKTSNQNKEHNNYTIYSLSIQFLDTVRIKVKESTYTRYHSMIYNHIIPPLGNMKVNKLNKTILDKFVIEKCNEKLSAKTMNDMITLLGQILKQKCIDIKQYNIVKPRMIEPSIKILTDKEQTKLIDNLFLDCNFEKLGISLSLFMGIRIGELCALTWHDIDFENKIISINKTMQRIKNLESNAISKTKIIITDPKSYKSIRMIPIPNIIYKKLEEFSIQNRHAYLLTGEINHFIEPRLFEYKFKKYINSIGLKEFNFHVLRHTFATKTLESNTDPKTLSELLGHTDVAFTLKKYVHPSFELKRACIENTAVNYKG